MTARPYKGRVWTKTAGMKDGRRDCGGEEVRFFFLLPQLTLLY